MEVSLYQAAAAMDATAQWQDIIAENLSASSVPGSRKQEVTFSDVQAGANSYQSGGITLPTAQKVTNFQPGELHVSGNSMDFALEGPGFFPVKTSTGQTAYTRDGEFQLNATNQITTKQGDLVMANGAPIQLDINNPGTLTVSANGNIAQGDVVLGKLQTFEFKNPQQLVMTGSGLYSPPDSTAAPTVSTNTKIRQGFLEAPNASPTTQMASLITAMRLFEANQKVMQLQGNRMSQTITDLTSNA